MSTDGKRTFSLQIVKNESKVYWTYDTVEDEGVLPYGGVAEYDALPDPGPSPNSCVLPNAHIRACHKANGIYRQQTV